MTSNDLRGMQQEAYQRMCDGESIFLTGAAGTGKSEVVKVFIQENKDKKILVCAPTALAAIKCEGKTLHSAFRIHDNPRGFWRKDESGKHIGWLSGLEVLIIDEISMCRIDLFEYIMKCLSHTGMDDIQIICVGDFFQLPPVVDMRTTGAKFKEEWGDKLYAFQSEYWQSLHPIVLKEVFRTDDYGYIEHLNQIRTGDKAAIDYFNRCCLNPPSSTAITICGRNQDADAINEQRLLYYMHEIDADIKVYGAINTDSFNVSSVPVENKIRLCTGIRVLTVLNDARHHLINGEIGIVEMMQEDSVRVRFPDRIQDISYYTWSIKDENGGTASFSQLPLRVAEAISIHKSQGQTFSEINIDPEIFETGQLYVALSRCKTIKGMHLLKKIHEEQLKVSPEILQYYSEIEKEANSYADNEERTSLDFGVWDGTKQCNVKKRVGFDRCLFALYVKSFDRKKFLHQMQAESAEESSFVCTYKKPTEKVSFLQYGSTLIPYSYIKLQIGKNSLVMKKNPIKGRPDICMLTLYVPPVPGHEVLGNIINLSVEEEKQYVRNVMLYIEGVYGIEFEKDIAIIRLAEININLRGGYQKGDFGELFLDNYKALEIVQSRLGKQFSHNNYTYSNPRKPSYRIKDNKNSQEMVNHGKAHVVSPETIYDKNNNVSLYPPGNVPVEFRSMSYTRILKVYDKRYQTMNELAGKDIQSMDELTRLEFELRKTKTIESYCGCSNLFTMTQSDIEGAFHELSRNLVEKPIQKFEHDNWKVLEKLFSNVKKSRGRAKGQWKNNLVTTMLEIAVKEKVHIELTEDELKRLVHLIPYDVVKTNRTNAIESIKKSIKKLNGNGIECLPESYRKKLIQLMKSIEGEEDQYVRYSMTTPEIEGDNQVAYETFRDSDFYDYYPFQDDELS